ncbi:hypothetical protein J437_LFUL003908 [Ladona fulva]|uniref:C2H2-type domain-containing protein n=1 Tax=Ladona fulva TaxID=123851 RepID=A0A8K0K650_LADFU|nr:hypothetical protein J437_LFUL003908 [Ladona fulva]
MKTTRRILHPPEESCEGVVKEVVTDKAPAMIRKDISFAVKVLGDEKETELCSPKKKSRMMEEPLESHNRLHMLAAVASQHLHSDPTMKGYGNCISPQKTEIPPVTIKFITSKSGILNNKRKRTPCRKAGDGEMLNLEQIRELSAHHLLKCFSDFDGNELKRTFTYSCVLDPTRCQRKFSSFGSELKARQQMKIHLLEHVNELTEEAVRGMHFKAETVQSRQKRQLDAANSLSRKKKTTLRSVSYNGKEEIKQRTAPNCSKVLVLDDSFSKDSKCGSNSLPITAGNINELTIKKELPHESFLTIVKEEPATSLVQNHFENELQQDQSMKEPVETGVKPGNPVALIDHNYVLHSSNANGTHDVKEQASNTQKSQDWSADRSETMLKNAIKTSSEEKLKSTSAELNKFMVSETLHDMIMVCVVEEEKLQLKQLPCVGSEMDVKTGQGKEVQQKKSPDSESEEESREIKTIHNNIERDEYRLKKKPKGKAKFIGQSKAEKEMAIQMIEAIKSRVTTLESLECQICNPPRSFTAPTTLISHYRSHAGIKPYECRLCRSVFTRQHSLNYHMLIHSNQTRFTCSDCGRKFRHPSHFKEHRRRHTGESPYEFKTRNTYKRHMRTHHGKMLTPSGELLVLSDDEFKQVRALPRISAKPAARIISKGKNSDSVHSKTAQINCEEDEMDFASDSSEANSDSNHLIEIPQAQEGKGAFKESNKENNAKIDPKDSRQSESKAGNQKAYFKDIVKEAMRQSDIPFSSDFRSCDNETIISDPLDFSVTEVVGSSENYYDDAAGKNSEDDSSEVVASDGLDSVQKDAKVPSIKVESQEKVSNVPLGCVYLKPDECVTFGNHSVGVVCSTPFSNNVVEEIKKEPLESPPRSKSAMLLFKPLIVNQGATIRNVIPSKTSINTSANILPQPMSILACQPVNTAPSEAGMKDGQAGRKLFIKAGGTLINSLKPPSFMLMNKDSTPQLTFCPLNNHNLSVKNGVFTGEATQL